MTEGRLIVGTTRYLAGLLVAGMALVARADDLLPPMTQGVPSEFAGRRAGDEVGANHRVVVSQPGLYRLSYSNLLAAGISNPVGAELRLFCRTQEIALATSNEGAWSGNDYAVFYGWPHEGYYTTSNTYWLGTGGSGLRMGTRPAAPLADAPNQTTRWTTATYEPNKIFSPIFRPTDDSFDHWFALSIVNSGQTNFALATPDRVHFGDATLNLGLWGRSSSGAFNPDHATRITLNNLNTQTSYFDGLLFHMSTTVVAQTVLSNGTNNVVLRSMFTDMTDNASLEWARLTYQASNRIVSGVLSFTGRSGSNNYTCGPWNTSAVPWLLDITDRGRPVRLLDPEVTSAGTTGQVRWGDASAGSNTYWLADPARVVDAAVAPALAFRGLTDTARQCDYLIIADRSLSTSAYRLAKYRARDGLRTLMVHIDEVYDEFSFGIKDAGAIKQFIGYAYHHWAGPPPRYVLLVGDGSYDPRNQLGLAGAHDLIPVHLGASPNEYCSLDGWFATVHGSDYLGDVVMGRFPVSTDAQMSNVVAKILGFEAAASNATWRGKALCVADQNDVNDFRAASDTHAVTNLVAAGVTTITKAYHAGVTATTRATITNAINGGLFSVTYFGHGYTADWAVGFNTTHVDQLNNTVWPIFNVLTCENGDFDNPQTECMTEKLLERSQRGAVATVSAAALSLQAAAEQFADGFYTEMGSGAPRLRLGDLMNAGFLNLWGYSPQSEELLFYGLFGDPALVVKP
jgi:hypothetical protein